jgi:hypothetical protein
MKDNYEETNGAFIKLMDNLGRRDGQGDGSGS